MSFKGVAIVLFLFLLGVAFSGFASYQSTLTHEEIAKPVDAEKLVKQNCTSCHGKDLKGDVGPNLHERGQLLSEEAIAAIIKDGVNGKMPGDLIKGDEAVAEVAKYITSLEK
ncbi:MAG TPA: cytochrome c [Bacilli bacterium]|nr:cytochrome c [Bacilli bacterium]